MDKRTALSLPVNRPWGQMEEEKKGKEESLYARLRFYRSALFDISVFYIKDLAYNLGSATEIITNITFVDDFVTFSIFN